MPKQPGSVGARGPNNPQKFFTPPKSQPTQSPALTIDDDSSQDWWGGVQLSFASLALASLALSASQTLVAAQTCGQSQDDLPSTPSLSVDECYGPPLQLQPSQTGAGTGTRSVGAFSADEEIVPQPLVFHADEDVWIAYVSSPPSSTPSTSKLIQPWGAGDDDVPPLSGQPDEDLWQNRAAPLTQTHLVQLPLGDVEEIPASFLHGQPDEDYWVSRVAPLPPVHFISLPLALDDPEEIPAGSLHGQPDEDYWQTPVYPSQLWQLGQLGQPWVGADESFPFVTFKLDEDFPFPVSPVLVSPVAFGKLYLPDPDETPAHSLYGQPEEEFWINWVAPQPTLFGKLYLPDAEELPAHSLHGTFEEDSYQPPQPWTSPTRADFRPLSDDDVPAPAHLDEDYWSHPVVVGAAEGVARAIGLLGLLGDSDEVIVPQPPLGPDEDFWRNWVFPLAPSYTPRYPWLEGDEFESGYVPPPPPVIVPLAWMAEFPIAFSFEAVTPSYPTCEIVTRVQSQLKALVGSPQSVVSTMVTAPSLAPFAIADTFQSLTPVPQTSLVVDEPLTIVIGMQACLQNLTFTLD